MQVGRCGVRSLQFSLSKHFGVNLLFFLLLFFHLLLHFQHFISNCLNQGKENVKKKKKVIIKDIFQLNLINNRFVKSWLTFVIWCNLLCFLQINLRLKRQTLSGLKANNQEQIVK